jgi:hypothetical protein
MASSSRLAAVLVASVLASVLVITATHTYGLGITPDSVSYVAAADSFRRSGTFVTYDGSPFSAWPPLLSIVMAILGDGAPSAMRWFHVAVAGLIVCLSGAIMVPVVRRDMALACGLTALIAARPLQLTANFLWSEPLFLACVVGSALALAREWLYLSAALVSLACLTRYTGIVLLAAFMVCSYAALEKPSRRLIAWSIAAVPLAMWILRNVTGRWRSLRKTRRAGSGPDVASASDWLCARAMAVACCFRNRPGRIGRSSDRRCLARSRMAAIARAGSQVPDPVRTSVRSAPLRHRMVQERRRHRPTVDLAARDSSDSDADRGV